MRKLELLLVPIIFAITSSLAQGATGTIAFGTDGLMFELRTGLYGELFPGEAGRERTVEVLALDVVENETRQRYLVPETDAATHRFASLVSDGVSDGVFIVWEAAVAAQSSLRLVGFSPRLGWTGLIELARSSKPFDQAPQIRLTRDTCGPFEAPKTRTVIHGIFTDEGESTYTPIVFCDGEYLGWTPRLSLSGFVRTVLLLSEPEPTDRIDVASVEPGENGLIVSILAPRAGKIVTLRIRVVPDALVSVATEARGYIPIFGAPSSQLPGGNLTSFLAGEIYQFISVFKAPFHAATRSYLAQQAADTVRGFGPTFGEDQLESIAEAVRKTLLSSGASMVSSEFETPLAENMCGLAHLGVTPEAPATAALHMIEICVVRALPIPVLGHDTPVRLTASRDGDEMLVLWQETSEEGSPALQYLLSKPEGWSGPHEVGPDSGLSLDEALAALRRLVRE